MNPYLQGLYKKQTVIDYEIYRTVSKGEFCNMKDLILDDNDDLLFTNGDLTIGISDQAHIKNILISNKGDWKEFPELGVSMEDMLNDDAFNQFLIDAKNNLKYDGFNVDNIGFTEDGKLNVEAKYK